MRLRAQAIKKAACRQYEGARAYACDAPSAFGDDVIQVVAGFRQCRVGVGAKAGARHDHGVVGGKPGPLRGDFQACRAAHGASRQRDDLVSVGIVAQEPAGHLERRQWTRQVLDLEIVEYEESDIPRGAARAG